MIGGCALASCAAEVYRCWQYTAATLPCSCKRTPQNKCMFLSHVLPFRHLQRAQLQRTVLLQVQAKKQTTEGAHSGAWTVGGCALASWGAEAPPLLYGGDAALLLPGDSERLTARPTAPMSADGPRRCGVDSLENCRELPALAPASGIAVSPTRSC